MNKREQEILQSLLKLYIDMYPSKNLFNKTYFKYTPEDIKKVFSLIISENQESSQKNRNRIRESILSINTEDEVKNFYLENLLYNQSDIKFKEECLKRISLDELKHLYSILFSSPLRTNIRKNELLDLIRSHFDSIDRAKSMKP
ncbi:MAG: hypothetical protein ABF649_22490 [Bacillus sp. (in: firmicutes)]